MQWAVVCLHGKDFLGKARDLFQIGLKYLIVRSRI